MLAFAGGAVDEVRIGRVEGQRLDVWTAQCGQQLFQCAPLSALVQTPPAAAASPQATGIGRVRDQSGSDAPGDVEWTGALPLRKVVMPREGARRLQRCSSSPARVS